MFMISLFYSFDLVLDNYSINTTKGKYKKFSTFFYIMNEIHDSNPVTPSSSDKITHEEILEFVKNATYHHVDSFHHVSPKVYNALFRAVFPELEIPIAVFSDLLEVLQLVAIQVYRPPHLNLEMNCDTSPIRKDADKLYEDRTGEPVLNYRHHAQLLVWFYDVGKRKGLRFEHVPPESLFREDAKKPDSPCSIHGNNLHPCAQLEKVIDDRRKRLKYLSDFLHKIIQCARNEAEIKVRRQALRKLFLTFKS